MLYLAAFWHNSNMFQVFEFGFSNVDKICWEVNVQPPHLDHSKMIKIATWEYKIHVGDAKSHCTISTHPTYSHIQYYCGRYVGQITIYNVSKVASPKKVIFWRGHINSFILFMQYLFQGSQISFFLWRINNSCAQQEVRVWGSYAS